MSDSITPGPATTMSGAALPLVALHQQELLTINTNDQPTLLNVLGEGINVKPLRVDIEGGQWVVLAVFSPGSSVPIHYHTGTVDALTLSGSWYYDEYSEQPQTAGSYMFEPAASVHTLKVPESNTEDTVVLFSITGANVNFNEDGTLHSILDAAMVKHLITEIAAAQGVEGLNYIEGGTLRYAES